MLISLYRGTSWISSRIQNITRSPYSHAAMTNEEDGKTWEAWHVAEEHRAWYDYRRYLGGHFREIETPWTGHEPGTPIEFYAVAGMTPQIHDRIRAKCEEWVARRIPYDYVQILRFITRSQRGSGPDESNRLFCSESDIIAFRYGPLNLLNSPASRTTPGHLLWSTLLRRVYPAWLPPSPS